MLLPALDGRGGRRASLPSLSLWQRRRLLLLLCFFMLFDDRGGRCAPSSSLSSLSQWRRLLLLCFFFMLFDGRGGWRAPPPSLSSLSLWRRLLLLLWWRPLLLLYPLLQFFGDGRSEPSLLHSSDVGSSDMSANCFLSLRLSLFLVVARMAFCISPRSCFFPIFLCFRKSLKRSDLRWK